MTLPARSRTDALRRRRQFIAPTLLAVVTVLAAAVPATLAQLMDTKTMAPVAVAGDSLHAPTLSGLSSQSDGVHVSWQAPSTGIAPQSYDVARRDPSSIDPPDILANVSNLSYSDAAVAQCNQYAYAIRARYGSMVSTYSSELTTTVDSQAPQIMAMTLTGSAGATAHAGLVKPDGEYFAYAMISDACAASHVDVTFDVSELGNGLTIGQHGSFTVGGTGYNFRVGPLTTSGVLADGALLPWSVAAVDPSGNSSSAPGSLVAVDAVAPAVPTHSVAGSPSNSSVTPTLSGTAETGSTVAVYIDTACTGTPAVSVVAVVPGTFSAQVAVAANATSLLRAQATDAAGNSSPCSTPSSYTHDSIDPVTPTLDVSPQSPANDNNPVLAGITEPGADVHLAVNDVCAAYSQSVVAAADGSFEFLATVANDSSHTYTVSASDAAGNISGCTSATYVEDSSTVTPTLTSPATVGQAQSITLTGSAEVGASVRLFIGPSCAGIPADTTTAAANGAFSFGVTVAANATTTYSVQATDIAHNTSSCSAPFAYRHDTIAPGVPVMLAFNPPSPSNNTAPQMQGTAEADAQVTAYTAAGCAGAPAGTSSVDGDGQFSFAVTVTANATTSLWAHATDAAGNISSCTTGAMTYLNDTIAPATPTAATTPADGSRTVLTPTVSGETEPGAVVSRYGNGTCSGSATGTFTASSPGGNYSYTITVSANTTTIQSVNARDAAGNVSGCTSYTYTHDNIAPLAPTLTGPASPSSTQTITLLGNAEAGSTVIVYTNPGACGTGSASAPITVGLDGSYAKTVTVAANATSTYVSLATDALGNVGACSSTFSYTHDNIAPTTPTGMDYTPSNRKLLTPTISGIVQTGTTLVLLYTNSSCTTLYGSQGPVTFSPATKFSIVVTVASGSTNTFYVQASDAAGNHSGCSSGITYIHNP